MLNDEGQKQIEHNIQRAEILHALRKIDGIVKDAQKEERIEEKVGQITLGVITVIVVLAVFFWFFKAGGITPTLTTLPPTSYFKSYADDWAKQVQIKLSKSCIDFIGTGNQSAGTILSTSIMKDGTVEKITIMKSSGIKGLDVAAVKGVLAAAPFSPEMKQDTDILTITRTFRKESCL